VCAVSGQWRSASLAKRSAEDSGRYNAGIFFAITPFLKKEKFGDFPFGKILFVLLILFQSNAESPFAKLRPHAPPLAAGKGRA